MPQEKTTTKNPDKSLRLIFEQSAATGYIFNKAADFGTAIFQNIELPFTYFLDICPQMLIEHSSYSLRPNLLNLSS